MWFDATEMTSDPTTYVKDLRPGLKNLNVIFIVLEIGESAVLVSDHHPTKPFTGTAEGLELFGKFFSYLWNYSIHQLILLGSLVVW